jgi:hypothetical protein
VLFVAMMLKHKMQKLNFVHCEIIDDLKHKMQSLNRVSLGLEDGYSFLFHSVLLSLLSGSSC